MKLVTVEGTGIYHLAGYGRWTDCQIPRKPLVSITDTDGLRPCFRCNLPDRPDPIVYFIEVERRGTFGIKIGYTRDLTARLVGLAEWYDGMRVLATTPGGRSEELAFHRRFKPWRRGKTEVFERSDAVLSCVAGYQIAAAA